MIRMKRLQVMLLAAFSSALLMAGCGKKEEAQTAPAPDGQVIDESDAAQNTDTADDAS